MENLFIFIKQFEKYFTYHRHFHSSRSFLFLLNTLDKVLFWVSSYSYIKIFFVIIYFALVLLSENCEVKKYVWQQKCTAQKQPDNCMEAKSRMAKGRTKQ